MSLKKPLVVANILLTVLIAGLAVQFILPRLKGSGEGPGESASPSERRVETLPVPSGPQGMNRYLPIIRQDMFHTRIQKKSASSKAPPPEPEEIKVTRLNLELMGTVVGREGDSYAVIAQGRAPEGEVYRVNDTIQNSRLLEILEDRVILDVDGEKQALVIEYDLDSRGGQVDAARSPEKRSVSRDQRRGFRGPRTLPGT